MPERSQYQRFGLVAQGQFGKVYCAFHRTTGEWVALKILDARRSPTAEFLRELSTVLALNHDNLVRFYGVEHQPQQRHLILDYCEGGTLRQLLNGSFCPQPTVLIQLLVELLHGLEHTHRQGIVHCDVKPENILLTLTPNGWRPKLTDFGVAQNRALPDTEQLGSPAYMAPESFHRQVSPAADVYAVGVVLHECLLGRRPFSGTPTQLQQAHRNQRLSLPTTLPIELKRVLRRALAKLPGRRFPDAATMATTLAAAQQALGPQSPSLFVTAPPPPPPWPSLQSKRETTPPILWPDWLPRLDPSTLCGLAPDQSWGAWIEGDGRSQRLICLPAPQTQRSRKELLLSDRLQPANLILLNPRHGVLVRQPPLGQGPTQLMLFNRRGSSLPPLTLPIAISHCTRSSLPLHLLALERSQPHLLLKIGLHPFRLQRIPLPFEPVAIAPLRWGMALADRTGQLLLLDHQGDSLGHWQTQTPQTDAAGGLVALRGLSDRQLGLILQPSPNAQPQLHSIDLQKLNLDLVF